MIRALVTSTALALAVGWAGLAMANEYQQGPAERQAASERMEGPLGEGARDTNIPVAEPNETATTRFPDTAGPIDLNKPPQVGDRQEGEPWAGQQARTPEDEAGGTDAAPAQPGMQR